MIVYKIEAKTQAESNNKGAISTSSLLTNSYTRVSGCSIKQQNDLLRVCLQYGLDLACTAIVADVPLLKSLGKTNFTKEQVKSSDLDYSGDASLEKKVNRSYWPERVFITALGQNVIKICEAAMEHANAVSQTVAVLIPARTASAWFHNLVFQSAFKVIFIKGKLHFESGGKQMKEAVCVVYYDNKSITRCLEKVREEERLKTKLTGFLSEPIKISTNFTSATTKQFFI